MTVVDTSALVAIFLEEAGHEQLLAFLAGARDAVVSAATYVEMAAVICGRSKPPAAGLKTLDAMLREMRVTVVPFDEAQAKAAAEARLRFGKGFGGPGGLNLGDTYSYALAKVRNAPLLFVGDDFSQTDIRSALVV